MSLGVQHQSCSTFASLLMFRKIGHHSTQQQKNSFLVFLAKLIWLQHFFVLLLL